MENFTQYIPKLTFNKYKGYGGKVAVVGGCFEYTGAPFFAAHSILRAGGDLSHIFCMKSAATAIKSYAPETIVHPALPEPDEFDYIPKALENVTKWYSAVDSFVIGPGLGRNEATMKFTTELISFLKTSQPTKPVILDGDALFLVSTNPGFVSGCKHFILTPNGGEYIRLCNGVNIPKDSPVLTLSEKLGGVNIFAKGLIDRFTDGVKVEEFKFQSSPRRVGGQGDLTAGIWGLFASYSPNNLFEAAGAVSEIVKKAALFAFNKHKRSTITTDILNEIENVIPESWYAVSESM
ncbi:carbohydrate kinase, putative [Trichomonas vaginalis G3]|uniref:ATP-dependent (S)-NAD(P)H-hydrate dehydratase n=1 Tax=Trichomonas vaginalis (strain ATCC PRA-98 / G3) TaxID=412133 RepID=A2EEQ9_TRIV3|nr:ADP-dependent NAD(P)H-hydrate dehydratase protein [Trichomonas vaginalis G3]EAY08865.1 carbohydrate kinase, putative [Trichomonas vaginalis G3]KAI5489360.1 ADP-dependent NAD(P)H-hydrate dehydratase protein [Trichomonas vaginalis G3]|eukprot:XP_001321088.1 carbohydrate kinase [Trichomonas vaginalis G3]